MTQTYWHGKLALITGASSGIGENIAKFLSLKGIKTIIVARRIEKLKSVASEIRSSGGKVFVYQADLSLPSNRLGLFQRISSEHGTPDILINNAGIGWYGYFSEMPWDVANEMIALNITATSHLTSLFLPGMLKLPASRIINIGSISGKLPEQGIAVYSASKAYVDAFTKSLYRELRGTTVTASVVRAGPIKTDFYSRALELPFGGSVPGEFFAVNAEIVSRIVWRLIRHPVRCIYVPFYLFLSPLLEVLFSWLLDIIGPVLLLHSAGKQNRQ